MIEGRAMDLRLLVADALNEAECLPHCPAPDDAPEAVHAAAAAIIEWLCQQVGQAAPPWVEVAPTLVPPRFVSAYASRMPRLRALCEAGSPEPFRRRGLLVPPQYLTTDANAARAVLQAAPRAE
jgi:hypothetical protein